MQSEEILRENTLFNSDLYQFTCSYSYFMSNKHEQEATFEVFFRKYPFGGKYVIFGGLRSVKDFFNNLSFTVKEEEYLKNKFVVTRKQNVVSQRFHYNQAMMQYALALCDICAS